VKFVTTFQNGTLLVSGNYDDPMPRGSGIVRQFNVGTLIETWNNHKARIHAGAVTWISSPVAA
jgi:hypothetical protein